MRVHASQTPFLRVIETEKFLPSLLAEVLQKHGAATRTVRAWSTQCSTTHLMVLHLSVLRKWNWQVEGQGEALQMQHGWVTAPCEQLNAENKLLPADPDRGESSPRPSRRRRGRELQLSFYRTVLSGYTVNFTLRIQRWRKMLQEPQP